MIDDSDQSLACDLFRRGKFTECCEFLQRISDSHHLEKITHQDEVEFLLLRNNLLVCNCLVLFFTNVGFNLFFLRTFILFKCFFFFTREFYQPWTQNTLARCLSLLIFLNCIYTKNTFH